MNLTQRKGFKIPVHIFVWLLLFSLPYLLSSGEQTSLNRIITRTWLPLIFYSILFYTNYFLLIDLFLFRKKTWLYILINLCLVALFIWSNIGLRKFIYIPPPAPMLHKPPIGLFIYKDIIAMLVPVIVSLALRTTERWTRAEAEKKEAEKESLKSELQHLKYQLQPHFFFNSLNNIYSLVDISPDKAKETIHSLAKLMRYLLYDTDAEKISLHGEIDFIKKYIELMTLRLPAESKITTDFQEDEKDLSVAPLLFISLIENAFKHGVSARHEFSILFRLLVEGQTITFTAENTSFPKTGADKSGSGIGLNNLRKRLELLYPDKHSFTTEDSGGIFKVKLVIDAE